MSQKLRKDHLTLAAMCYFNRLSFNLLYKPIWVHSDGDLREVHLYYTNSTQPLNVVKLSEKQFEYIIKTIHSAGY